MNYATSEREMYANVSQGRNDHVSIITLLNMVKCTIQYLTDCLVNFCFFRRTSHKLVHQLECVPNTMVKCFKRSAAGCSLNNPNLLRPPSVLKTTISYLLNE